MSNLHIEWSCTTYGITDSLKALIDSSPVDVKSLFSTERFLANSPRDDVVPLHFMPMAATTKSAPCNVEANGSSPRAFATSEVEMHFMYAASDPAVRLYVGISFEGIAEEAMKCVVFAVMFSRL